VVYAEQPAGFLFEPNSLFVQPVSVPKGQEYKLTITNTHEDGINDPGYVAVYYGSQAATENEIVTATTIETPRTEIVFSVRSENITIDFYTGEGRSSPIWRCTILYPTRGKQVDSPGQ
jgi:hypothetical protein